ncbi:MAG: FecR domain-containing protein, partial [Gemmataceae bacterium]|nr:FecR domain-containing protein [Gemmataceae bacterium]
MSQHDIADQNVERLLVAAYRPEPIDPAFVLETEEKLLTAARTESSARASLRAVGVEPDANLMRIRRRLSWAMIAATVAAVTLLSFYARHEWPNRLNVKSEPEPKAESIQRAAFPTGLTAKPRPAAAKPQAAEIGETIATKHNERRRVALADGSILYVNENTTLTSTAIRQLRLDRGDIYLEVARGPIGFTVQTPKRQVIALGTHFHVAVDAAGSGVLVTQGTVKVSDVPNEVTAGQQVKPGSKQTTAAPRASHVLDWLKPLVAAADAALVPSCQHEGGALVAIDPNGQELQLTLRKYHIDVHIEDGFARTTIDQTYFNNTWSRLEGTFYFPLPPDASLSRLAMYVLDGKEQKLMEGGMAERDQARNAFETIRYERRDPALLEWVDGSTFKMRVFPLEAWHEKRIILSYTQRLSPLYGVARYRFPGGHNMQIVRDWSFAAHVENAKNWDVIAASHPEMKRADTDSGALDLRTAAQLIKPEQDVVLELREREAPSDGVTFATHLQDGQRYFMARYRPKLDTRPERQRRDWIVLFESSANRDPLLARTQIDVFRNLLKNVEYDDTFTLLTANTRLQLANAKPQAAVPANVQAAVEFLDRTHLVGGCDLEQALRKAVELAKNAKNPHIVHLGAGVPSLGEPKDDVLARLLPEDVRYIGVGVGKKWNRAFMKMAADRTGGYFTQINPDEPVAWRAFDLLATLNTPRLLDVRVIDPDERVTYLTDAVTLAQGEEICAYTRGPTDKFAIPKKVIVTGRLEGKPFHRELEVRSDSRGTGYIPAPSAAYLPRTWAKLEIDRLLADGQDKNRAAITELSKAMYVMSPFTSLLVLESEADYKRFNIDRGRKDHWAMYACPDRIPQVYEPDPAYRHWWRHVEQPKEGQKPSEEQVLDTILVRLPPRYVFAPGRQVYLPHRATARQVLYSAYAVPDVETFNFGARLGELDERRVELETAENVQPASGSWGLDFRSPRFLLRAGGGGDFRNVDGAERLQRLSRFERGVTSLGRSGGFGGRAMSRMALSKLRLNLRLEDEARFLREELVADRPPLAQLLAPRGEAAMSGPVAAGRPMSPAGGFGGEQAFRRVWRGDRALKDLAEDAKAAKKSSIADLMDFESALVPGWPSYDFDVAVTSLDGLDWPGASKQSFEEAWMLQLAGQLSSRQSASWLTYQRPQQQVDHRLFGDLTIHAPGLNTSWADIQNTVTLEAQQQRPVAAGKIDEAARALIDKARQTGWHAVSYPGVGRIPGFNVLANGAGQFTYQRVLSSGLIEQVICDGETLWHLYPEIGLGARRPFSRFHFGELSRWTPWSMPKAEDLALGADLRAVNATTVALVRHAPPRKKSDDKAPQSRELHFVFAADGRLAETQLVEMPAGKILARQVFDAGGMIRILDEAGKQLAEHKLVQADAEAPSIKPKLDDVLILDMPLRTEQYWDRRINELRNDAKAKNDESLLKPVHLGLFASSCFSRDRDSLPMFGAYFHAKGDRRLGFYTLLSAREQPYLKRPNTWAAGIVVFDPVAEHPRCALARYLAHHQENINVTSNADRSLLEDMPSPADSFIGRLTSFRNAWSVWRMGHQLNVGNRAEVYQRELAKTREFLRINTSPLVAFLLQSNMQYLNSHDRADLSRLIHDVQKEYVHPLGLGYILGTDAAYHLYYKGDRKEASRLYRELYETAVKEGVLPKIDRTFQNALDDASSQGPNFGAFMRTVVHDFLRKDQPHLALMA